MNFIQFVNFFATFWLVVCVSTDSTRAHSAISAESGRREKVSRGKVKLNPKSVLLTWECQTMLRNLKDKIARWTNPSCSKKYLEQFVDDQDEQHQSLQKISA